jgi:N-acetylglucosaminyl-diphospho-decaprenol L-rhamnosyltransferase
MHFSDKNIGMGAGNNLGLKNVKTDFVLILNPDVILKKIQLMKL